MSENAEAVEACGKRWLKAGREVSNIWSPAGCKDINDAIRQTSMTEHDHRFKPEAFSVEDIPFDDGARNDGAPAHGVAVAPQGPRTDENALLLSAWLKRELPLRRFLLGNVLCTTSRWIVYGETGVGKTLLAADIAAAIAAGASFLNWQGSGRRARVMYLDGEMPAETFKERMEIIARRYGADIQLYGYNRDVLSRWRNAAAEHAGGREVALARDRGRQAGS